MMFTYFAVSDVKFLLAMGFIKPKKGFDLFSCINFSKHSSVFSDESLIQTGCKVEKLCDSTEVNTASMSPAWGPW